jgi:glycosyltransferase involved in cell wall biosynthesis
MQLISIVINNFNYARYLRQSIDSALAQDYPNVEVVVVDDCSTDGSREIIARYGDRVIPVLAERNGGQAAAFNAGFAASHGTIVMLLDADDYLYPNAATEVERVWVSGCSKVHYRLDLVSAVGEKIDVYPPPEVRFDSGDVVPRLLEIGRYETSVTSGSAFSRRVLQRVLPAPEEEFRISADGYLATVAPFHGPVIAIERPLGAYRQHEANTWAPSACKDLGSRLRRCLDHDQCKHRALERKARELSLAVSPALGLKDHQHLEARLASLRIGASQHPYPTDSRFELALRGALASATARTTWARRGVLASWFMAVGFLPGPLAARAVDWRLARRTRPVYIDRMLKFVRRATSGGAFTRADVRGGSA